MGLETTTTIAGLVSTNPLDADMISSGDDHLRLIKAVLKATFPGAGAAGYAIPITVFESQLNRLITQVDSIADLILQPKTGQKIIATNGYFTVGDGGHGYYWLDLADTTSVADNFSVHVAADGGRWKLIHTGHLFVSQAGAIGGASIVTTRIQKVIDFAATLNGSAEPTVDLCGLSHTIDTTLEVTATNITLKNGALVAHSTFFNDAGGLYFGALIGLKTSITRTHLYEIVLDGAFLASGIYNNGANTDTIISRIEVKDALNFGIKLAAGGKSKIFECLLTQSQSVAALRTGDGLYIDVSDCKVFNNIIRYWGRPVVITSGTLLFEGNHIFNGSPASIDVPIPNSTLIEITSGDNCTFIGNYLDKGRIIFRNVFNSTWIGNIYLFDTVPIHDSIFVFDCLNVVSKGFPRSFVHIGAPTIGPISSGAMDFIEFIGSTGGTWTPEALDIATKLTAQGALPICIGETTNDIVTSLGRKVVKAATDSEIAYTGYGITNTPILSWKEKELRYRCSGLVHKVVGSGSAGTGAYTVEGSRTTASGVASKFRFADRRGSSDLELTDTDLGYFEWLLLGNTGTNKNTLRLVSSVPGSATENTEWEFNNAGFRPGTDNKLDIGDATHKVQGLYVVEPIISPATVVTMNENLTIGFRWVDDTHFDFLQRGSDGVTRSVRLTTA